MKSEENFFLKDLLTIAIGVFALFALKSIFSNDESKIVSKKGKRYLNDESKMDEINEKINSKDSSKNHQDVFI